MPLVPQSYLSLKNYDRQSFLADLFAGVTVGFVALPLAMAFAIASGLPPERGLFTAIVAGFLISALGGSRVQIGGPTGAFVVIVSGIYGKYGYDGLVYSTIMAGGLLIALGLARMGALIKFIPFPVTTGFTTGIAVVIFSTQIKDLLGLRMQEVPPEFLPKWGAYLSHLGTFNFRAAGVGLGTIVVILGTRRLAPKAPAMLVGMLVATLAAWVLGLDVETIGTRFGELPRTLPQPALPVFALAKLRDLVSPAFTVAMLAAIESLLSATVADGMMGNQRHKPNIELIAQGLANIASVIFGGIPATGAIARTATNVRSGAKTPVAGMIHAIVLLCLLIFAAPLAKMIPLAALAGILVVVSYNMAELDHFVGLTKGPRSDLLVLLSTFALTVLVDLTVAVEVGLVMAAFLFMRQMAEVTNVGAVTRELGDQEDAADDPNAIGKRRVPGGVEVFEIEGPFFFGAADKFLETVRQQEYKPKVVILRLRAVPAIDATGLHALRSFHRLCVADRTALLLSGVHAQPLFALQGCGLWSEIGEDNMFGNIDDALNRARDIVGVPREEPSAPFIASVTREFTRMGGDPPKPDR